MKAGGSLKWTSAAPVALVVAFLVVPANWTVEADQDAEPLEWWGPTEIGQGHHIRVPVTVRNAEDYPIESGLVLAEVDLTSLLVDEGWTHEVRGFHERLSSFALDPNGIEVVEMFDLDSPKSGFKHGTIKAQDVSLPAADLSRSIVPSVYYEGFVSDRADRSFDNETNPAITVMWTVEDRLAPDEERYYVIYADTTTNIEHPESDGRSLLGADALYNSFWSGPGVQLVGHALPRKAAPASVTVLGLFDDTEVQVFVADQGGSFAPQVPPAGVHTNPFTISTDQTVDVVFGNDPTTFKLTADRPVLAVVDSEGFVPTRSGSFEGHEFLFASTYPESRMQDSIFFINRHPDLETRPDHAQTVVELQRLRPDGGADGPPREIHLSDGVNPFPYTLGFRYDRPSDQAACTFDETELSPRLGPDPGTYKARVLQGGPIAIQMDAVDGVTQVPSLTEGPTGTAFLPVLAKKTHPTDSFNGSCPSAVIEAYNMFAAAKNEAHLGVWNVETGDQHFPGCQSPPCQLLPVGDLGSTADFRTVDTEQFADRPLDARMTGPAWLFTGRTEAQTLGSLAVHGPLGGHEGAREFRGIGDAFIYAPFEDTRVTLATVSQPEPTLANVARDRAVRLSDITTADPRGQWYSMESTRPLFVNPTSEDSTFLASAPARLDAVTHAAEYRGHLVDITSTNGLNPVTASTVPGEPVEYEFLVTNKGQGVGRSNLADTLQICPTGTEDLPPGWSAEVQGSTGCDAPASLTLSSFESRSIRLTVTPPDDAAVADVVLGVRVASLNNPAVSDSIGTITHLKTSYDVGLWFDFAGQTGLKKKEAHLPSANETATFKVIVQNLGSVRDTLRLSLSGADPGWTHALDGEEAFQVALDPQEIRSYTLSVSPDKAIDEGSMPTTITAQSSVPSVLNRATAITKVEAPSDVTLGAQESTVWVGPGANATFNITASNHGDGTARLQFATQHDQLPRWGDPRLFLVTPATGQRTEIDELSLSPGQSAPLALVVPSDPFAEAGLRSTTRLQAVTDVTAGSKELFLQAIVQEVHDLTVVPEADPVQVPAGATEVNVLVDLSNHGNLHETLRFAPADLPIGWEVEFPADIIDIPRNQSQPVELKFRLPNGTSEGAYDPAFRLVGDQYAKDTTITFHVGSFSQLHLPLPPTMIGQPGRPALSVLNFTNGGNTALTLEVSAASDEDWLIDAVDRVVVQGQADVQIPIVWQVPPTAGVGSSVHGLLVEAQPDDPGADAIERTITVQATIGRADLVLEDARIFRGPSGLLVHARAVNNGDRSGFDVTVDLLVGDRSLDRVVLAEIGPGSHRNVTLLLPEGSDIRNARLVIDLDDHAVESDEANNALLLAPDQNQESPGASLALAVLALIAVLACVDVRRRRG